jgi:glycosyltransferase involved in cell wall biosynthesis
MIARPMTSPIIDQPLVSIGLPTCCRPSLLANALKSLTRQDYTNLEIIVADNGGPNTGTQEVVDSFKQHDSRIIYHRHKQNIGIWQNFLFVLRLAHGSWFMWAADDDDWHPSFIRLCLTKTMGRSSIMSGMNIRFLKTGREEPYSVPDLSALLPKNVNVNRFLKRANPSLIYGLHHMSALTPMLNNPKNYDAVDMVEVMRIILTNNFNTIPEVLYTLSIPEDAYVVKPVNGRYLCYSPMLCQGLHVIASSHVGAVTKLKLACRWGRTVLAFFYSQERHTSLLVRRLAWRAIHMGVIIYKSTFKIKS